MESGKASQPLREREPPVFAAVIRPHRSLGRDGFRTVMVLCCLGTAAASIPFVVLGAWPVAGFFGLDLLALYAAFLISFRSGRSFEELELTPLELLFRKVTWRGEAREWRFNPLWTRLDREEDDEFGLQHLALISRGERVVIARDLSPPERESLADALGRALSDVRRGY
ncbi:MAG TPA: DUF2244 domain-containing protein [Microvirga sp.]|jgi:uncharacterized membrane protein|nr:DUF2244 domain-containing protein [Microvirga sp.]